eukprot:CFRG8451T1
MYLDSDVLLLIFHHLPQDRLPIVGQVCKQWHQISLDASLWTCVEGSVVDKWSGRSWLSNFPEYVKFLDRPQFKRLAKLSFPYFDETNSKLIQTSTTKGSSQHPVTNQYDKDSLEKEYAKRLPYICPEIRTLDLIRGRGAPESIWRHHVEYSGSVVPADVSDFARLPNLESVWTEFEDRGVYILCKKLGKRLVDLRLDCSKVEWHRLAITLRRFLDRVVSRCPNIRSFCLYNNSPAYKNCIPVYSRYAITFEDMFINLVSKYPKLERLSIAGVHHVASGNLYRRLLVEKENGTLPLLHTLEVGSGEVLQMDISVKNRLEAIGLLRQLTNETALDSIFPFSHTTNTTR